MPATAAEIGFGLDEVEILNVGTHNGHAVTAADLNQIAANFPLAGFLPAVKVDLGGDRPTHADGGPAFGFVTGLRTKGAGRNKILIARLEHIPQEIMDLIDTKQFDRISAEIHPLFERDGGDLLNVLGAVELLGASIPAVPGLKPVSESVRLAANSETLIVTTPFSLKEAAMPKEKEKETPEEKPEPKAKGTPDESKILLAQKTEEATALKAELDALKAKTEGDGSEVKRLAQQVATLEESNRQAQVAALVGTLKVKGGMVEELSAIIGWALERQPDEVIKLAATTAGEKPLEVNPLGVPKSIIKKLNAYSAYMLKEHSTGKVELSEAGEPSTRDEAADRVDELVHKAIDEGKAKDYKAGLKLVLSQDSELKKLYTAAK